MEDASFYFLLGYITCWLLDGVHCLFSHWLARKAHYDCTQCKDWACRSHDCARCRTKGGAT